MWSFASDVAGFYWQCRVAAAECVAAVLSNYSRGSSEMGIQVLVSQAARITLKLLTARSDNSKLNSAESPSLPVWLALWKNEL